MTEGRTAPRASTPNLAYPKASLFLGIGLTCLIVLSAGWLGIRNYASMRSLTETELRIRWLTGEVMRLDEVLTMSARMAAATGELKWESRYRLHEPELDARIEEIMKLVPDAYANASETEKANRRLVEIEHRSFERRRAGDLPAARALLESAEYVLQKEIYGAGMVKSNDHLLSRASARLAAQKDVLIVSAMIDLFLCVALGFIWVRIIRALTGHSLALGHAVRELAQANASLESRVHERTAELSSANRSLELEMERRLRAEIELRQAQKLEAIGRLASGVAHEINTPVQFVSDNIHFVRDAMKDLLGVLDKLGVVRRCVLDGIPSQDAITEAAVAEEAADIPFLAENIPQALDSALDGLGRVATIVLSMKEFAHPDQKEMTTVDLNHAIQSALNISRNEYKYVAELETDFGELPPVLCHAGDLNQVVLNILVNGAHAVGDVVKGTDRKGRIRVHTHRDGDHVVISIGDTGTGIPEELRERIFDPFFTTKKVGEGTGQGLFIARAIVAEKHGGQLTFETAMGKGTTFFVRVPISGRQKVT